MVNGFGSGSFGPGDWDALSRQYMDSWAEMMRNAAATAPGAMPGTLPGSAGMPGPGGAAGGTVPGWNEALAWWTQAAKNLGAGTGADAGINDALDRFNSQARAWFSQMQQVAAQAGQSASAAEITQAWKQALGGQGANPFADMFRTMRGPGQHGFEQWVEQAAPFLQGFERWQRDSQPSLDQPTFGFMREHQERWQKLAQAQRDHQKDSQAYNALMSEAATNAFARFEAKLAERTDPGHQIDSARALFDLWIDAAEEAYAEIALSPRFREAYGAMVNSQMRLRASLQAEIERIAESLGMPTRTEVDSAHHKIVQLQREMRHVRDVLQARSDQTVASGGAATRTPARKTAVKKTSSTEAAARKTTARQPAATKSAAKKVAAKKTPAKKTPAKKTLAKKTAPARKASPAPASKRAGTAVRRKGR